MTCTLRVSSRGRTIFVTPKGPFELSTGFSLWESLRPDDWRCDWYVFDMVEVNDLRDSGLQWLRIFMNWAQQTDVSICIINLQPRLVKRCEDFGIELVDGEPMLRNSQQRTTVRRQGESQVYALN